MAQLARRLDRPHFVVRELDAHECGVVANRGERRTTTITALSPVTVMEIKTKALDAATDGCQVGFNKAFMRVLIDRLVQANRMIAQRL